MSYESQAEPIKFGCVYDFKLPDSYPQDRRDDLPISSRSRSSRT